MEGSHHYNHLRRIEKFHFAAARVLSQSALAVTKLQPRTVTTARISTIKTLRSFFISTSYSLGHSKHLILFAHVKRVQSDPPRLTPLPFPCTREPWNPCGTGRLLYGGKTRRTRGSLGPHLRTRSACRPL